MADRIGLDPERWERAVEIFERALELPHASRNALITAETAGDTELAGTVRSMLAADESDSGMLDQGLGGVAHIATEPLEDDPLNPGDTLGNFEIVGQLGRGGMGVVYAARDKSLGRIAALKLLPHRAGADSATDRLLAEAQAASALDHPNVATIYQVGEHEGRRFIAMARYEGETLRDRLSRGPIAMAEALDIARQIASGLAAAHASGLVHRDVKPANIFLTRQGLAKLLDFGIATLGDAGDGDATTRGTVRYMSPEQARGETVDRRSDLWSLGVVLFEMITGRTPFTGRTPREILASITASSPTQSITSVPGSVRSIVGRALERDRTKRYNSADEIMTALDGARAAIKPASRFRAAAIAAAAVIVIGIAAFVLSRDRPTPGIEKPVITIASVTSSGVTQETSALAAGLTEEIAARLIALGRVRVMRSLSANADYHLSLSPVGENQQIHMRLVKARDSRQVWTATRNLDSRILRELSRSTVIDVLTAVGSPPTEKERSQIGSGFPSNANAYREFLLGNQLLSIRAPGSVERALSHYKRAAELDTLYAAAFARQSYAYSVLLDWGWKSPAGIDPLTEGLSLADRAVALDSTAAEPWLARAYILVHRDPKRFEGAVSAFQHAIALDPYNPEAFHQYGQALMVLGRYTEALAAYRRSMDLEPTRAMTLVPIGAIYKRMGNMAEGLRYLDSAVSITPGVAYVRAIRSFHLAHMGELKRAREDAEESLRYDSTFRVPGLAAMAKVLWLAGDTAGARARLAEAERSVAIPQSPSPTESFMLSVAYVAMGQSDRAEQVLRAARPRGAWLWFFYMQPELERFRERPAARAILSEADPRAPG